MDNLYINRALKDRIIKETPLAESFEEKLSNWWGRGNNWWNRKLVFHSILYPKSDPSCKVRFEIVYDKPGNNQWPAYLDLHIDPDFRDLAEFLQTKDIIDQDLEWDCTRLSCRYIIPIENTLQQTVDIVTKIQGLFNPMMKEYLKSVKENGTLPQSSFEREIDSDVSLHTMTLLQLLNLKLEIPDYQRIYCWDESSVKLLWKDIKDLREHQTYRLGTIILQRKDESFDIIDGQQRLVTLALILSGLNITGIPLLEQSYQSKKAEEYISYNKYVISLLLAGILRDNRRKMAEKIWNNIDFNVLILNDNSLDLAYTFFSNENSRGKALTDFDLLKAHHLRYLAENEEQSKHIARKWDRMILEGKKSDNVNEMPHIRSLALYIFRLRHWIRKKQWDENESYIVKREYEAAPIINEIPPFGEHFNWNESIQGGSHFFSYVDTFIKRFHLFTGTSAYKAIHKLDTETHIWYRDVIESLLFAYYLKFEEQYLSEALVLISRTISYHRYGNTRAHLGKLLEYASDSEIVMMIDRATSPTFFLAELIARIDNLDFADVSPGIQTRYRELLFRCLENCKADIEIETIAKYLSY